MKKNIIIFVFILICISSLLEAKSGEEKLHDYIENDMIFALYPYDGWSDINLRDEKNYYPMREGQGTIGWGGDIEDTNDTTSNKPKLYYSYQMIAHGIAEGLYTNDRYTGDDEDDRVLWNYSNSKMTVTIDCPSDFMFVSQSDTSYKRPFVLYLIPNYESVGDPGAGGTGKIDRDFILVDNPLPHEIKFGDNPSDEYVNIWFDLIIGLPGEMDDNGVTYNNVYYPLSDATDYTAEVTIRMEWELKYTVQRRERIWGIYRWVDDHEATKSIVRTITIPFSGYCSFEEPTESVGSLYINTTVESQNINLNPDFIEPVKVADISYLYNFGHGAQIGDVNEDVNKTWLFLSASPDPWSNSDSNIFRMYHVSAGSEADEYNSIPFMVYVEDTDGSNQYVEFTGNEKAPDFSPVTAKGGSSDFIKTKCNNEKARSAYSSEDVDHPVQYYHYHSFDGEVWVEVMPQTDLMAAGRYIGDIYVHVIAEE